MRLLCFNVSIWVKFKEPDIWLSHVVKRLTYMGKSQTYDRLLSSGYLKIFNRPILTPLNGKMCEIG